MYFDTTKGSKIGGTAADIEIELLKKRLCPSAPVRSDEILVSLGARVFCVKLEFRSNDEKLSAAFIHTVATIKFSFDFATYSGSLSKTKAARGGMSYANAICLI